MKPLINLLVVDDEPDTVSLFRQRFRAELGKGEVRLETAEDGLSALEVLKDYHREIPLVILSDINMPRMDGIELLKAVRDRFPDLKVWMVSAYIQNPQFLDQAKRHGAEAFFSKPIDFRALKARLFQMEA